MNQGETDKKKRNSKRNMAAAGAAFAGVAGVAAGAAAATFAADAQDQDEVEVLDHTTEEESADVEQVHYTSHHYAHTGNGFHATPTPHADHTVQNDNVEHSAVNDDMPSGVEEEPVLGIATDDPSDIDSNGEWGEPGDISDYKDGEIFAPLPQDEIEVIDYHEGISDDGSVYEEAIVMTEGSEVHIIDTDVDGIADYMAVDTNENGIIDMHEMSDISDDNIQMDHFQEMYGYNSEFDSNDMPDYVDDASDADSFMA